LQKYKYKKQVPKLANEDILKMKNFIKELKWVSSLNILMLFC
jgi:hypothetical protein